MPPSLVLSLSLTLPIPLPDKAVSPPSTRAFVHARCETKLCSGEARRSRCPVFCFSLAEEVNVYPFPSRYFFPTETTVRQPQHRVSAFVHSCMRACVRTRAQTQQYLERQLTRSRGLLCRLGEGGGGEGTQGGTTEGSARVPRDRQSGGRVHSIAGGGIGSWMGKDTRQKGEGPDARLSSGAIVRAVNAV